MFLAAVAGLLVSMGAGELPAWTFDQDGQGWTANAHLARVSVKGGRLCADAVDWDPFFTCSGLSIEAKPWQYVVASLRANKSGSGELFWTGDTEGENGGFSGDKRTPFQVVGNNQIQEVVIFPFWQSEKTIRQLRLDLYNGAHFEIDAIQVLEWGKGAAPQTNVYSWEFKGDAAPWRVHAKAKELFSPPLNLKVKGKGWAAVTVQSGQEGTASLLWSVGDARGMQSADFAVEGWPDPKTYNVELDGIPAWHDGVVALGVRLPDENARLESLAISNKRQGPAEVVVNYVGFEDALNRAKTPCAVIGEVSNRGGAKASGLTTRLILSSDLRFQEGATEQPIPSLDCGETKTVRWTVSSAMPGDQKVYFRAGDSKVYETTLRFLPAQEAAPADYVPKPKPVKSTPNVCAYYFPGWDSDAKWDCIRRMAPNRKPALGYYDESNPECVDWQIKWATENGISCFLVDWYWVAGAQQLTHWFDAYRKARYRDDLQVAIMWANHNPPGTHSAEDWHAVTQHWIDQYFNLPAYYRIDGKPAVFIWAPENVRNDLKGSEAVKKAMDDSQAMARQAGYEGITFVAMGDDFSQSRIKALEQEGYSGITTYHEWGENLGAARRVPYETVVKNSPAAWVKKNTSAGALTYYPVIDTGWDARPWHGDKSLVIEGRTPKLFDSLLESAKKFAQANKKKLVILGPLNEWGEGSYIEPCVEYGFDMYETVRNNFGWGNPRQWPVNTAPRDVGRGPYDFAVLPAVSAWTFDKVAAGWKAMMGVADMACSNGCLRLRTTTGDPAIVVDTHGVEAKAFSKAVIKMQVTGKMPAGARGQLFWSAEGSATTEAASVQVPLTADGQMHTYTLDLKANPRWRNRITTLRLDPCDVQDVDVSIDEIKLVP